MFAALPVNPLTRIADIDSNHLNAPRNSIAVADVERISFVSVKSTEKRNMTVNIRKIHFFRQHIPDFECIPGCHDCCGPVTTSSEEMFELPHISDAVHEAALVALSCPHLGDHGCTTYRERPIICRLFGTTERLPCPHGRRPTQMIDPMIDQQIQDFFLDSRQVLV
jgi:hypothetical protein